LHGRRLQRWYRGEERRFLVTISAHFTQVNRRILRDVMTFTTREEHFFAINF